MIIVRENTEDLYKGFERRVYDVALGVRVILREGSRRICKFAFKLARKEGRRRVTIVHKANILKETCGLFCNTCLKVGREYSEVQCDEMHVDTAAFKLVAKPSELDVIVTTNMFGDVLSDLAAGLIGGLGMAPGANIGDRFSIFEPAHSSAPKYAGKSVVNPSAMILSSVMMLKHLGELRHTNRIEQALNKVLEDGRVLTYGLRGKAKTMGMAEEVIRNLP